MAAKLRTATRALFSSAVSAYICLSLAFSRSSSFIFFRFEGCRPPYSPFKSTSLLVQAHDLGSSYYSPVRNYPKKEHTRSGRDSQGVCPLPFERIWKLSS